MLYSGSNTGLSLKYLNHITFGRIGDHGIEFIIRFSGFPILGGVLLFVGGFFDLVDASDDWSDSTEDSREAAEHFEAQWNAIFPRFRHLRDELSGL